jgi:hypothetical protein
MTSCRERGVVAEVPAVRGRMWDVGEWKRRGGDSELPGGGEFAGNLEEIFGGLLMIRSDEN